MSLLSSMRHHAFTKPEVFGASAHPGSRPAGDALHGSAASAATPPVALLGVALSGRLHEVTAEDPVGNVAVARGA